MNSKKIAYAIKDYFTILTMQGKIKESENYKISIDDIIKIVDSANPTEYEESLESARLYLSDKGELSLSEMIERIQNHYNQDDLIDNVDGVTIHPHIQYLFSCQDFLKEINSNKF